MSFMKRTAIAVTGVACAIASPAIAAPTLFAGNGHYYDYIAAPVTWAAARDAAAASSFMGRQGYLATLTSAAEDNFLRATFGTATAGDPNGTVGWLGGSDSAVENGWRWVTGPEAGTLFYVGRFPTGTTVTYSNWSASQPDDDAPGDGEDFLVYRDNGWNDLRGSAMRGYFIEYGAAVPEPSTWAMMIAGFGLIGGALRRRRDRPALA